MIGEWIDLTRAHAPLLLFAIPLAAAGVAACIPSGRGAWALSALAAFVTAILALDLSWRALTAGVPPRYREEGLAVALDGVGAFALPLIACVGAFALLAAGPSLLRDLSSRAAPLAFALMLAVIGGWAGAAVAADFVGMFAAAQTAWLASVGLVALMADRDRAALTGALRMLSAGAVAGALMLLGAALAYRGAGVLEFAALAEVRVAAPAMAATGLGLMMLALAILAGAAPLHLWIGAALGRSGAAPSLAIGVIGVCGALVSVARVSASATPAPGLGEGLAMGLAALGAVSVVVGSMQAIGARSVRRLIAYAGVAQVGCILVSLALGSPAGVSAALVQIAAFAAAALALFGGAATLGAQAPLSSLDGFTRRAPLASAAIALGALSLMGAPMTLGFLGRWRLIEAVVNGGWWWAAAAMIVASLSAIFYGGRLIERIYFRRAEETVQPTAVSMHMAIAPALLAAMATILVGVQPGVLLALAGRAAHWLLGAAP